MGFPKGFNPWQYRKKKEEEKEPEPFTMEVIVEESAKIIKDTEAPYKIEPNHKNMLEQIRELRRSVNRHAIGLEKALQDYQDAVAKPVCVVCYVNKGWLAKCACNSENKEVIKNGSQETNAQDAPEGER